ncbi:MAG: hypothetical protein J3K34DRAFT_410907 [Monoraphidium minutum]|nr:MAG: hypothetical protein J3K34DRAFT_410907 [Monoraphidium minutum]
MVPGAAGAVGLAVLVTDRLGVYSGVVVSLAESLTPPTAVAVTAVTQPPAGAFSKSSWSSTTVTVVVHVYSSPNASSPSTGLQPGTFRVTPVSPTLPVLVTVTVQS